MMGVYHGYPPDCGNTKAVLPCVDCATEGCWYRKYDQASKEYLGSLAYELECGEVER